MFWDSYSRCYDAIVKLDPYRELVEIIETCAAIKEEDLVLDLGCGTGNFMRNRKNVIGVDVSLEMLKTAQKKNPTCLFSLVDCDQGLPFKDSIFDIVIVNNVLNYVHEPEWTICEIARVLKNGGMMLLSVLKRSFSPFQITLEHIKKKGIKTFFFALPSFLSCAFYNALIVKDLRSGRYRSFANEEMQELLDRQNFKIFNIKEVYASQNWFYLAQKSLKSE